MSKVLPTFALLLLQGTLAGTVVWLPLCGQAAVYRYADLNPPGFKLSYCVTISGNQQGGWGDGHALLWFGTASSVVDLNPSNYTGTVISGISCGQQVGQGYIAPFGPEAQALLWFGAGSSVVVLPPFWYSQARGISGTEIVGWGRFGGRLDHALLWSGADHHIVDLHPVGFTESEGWGVSGNRQVGTGYGPSTADQDHALIWSRTAGSVVDLHPRGFGGSGAFSIAGNQQVGSGDGHAFLWFGTAESVVDLNPRGFEICRGYGTSGTQQVGSGSGPATGARYIFHALLWSGSAETFVDLHSFLPAEYASSEALGIDASGNIVGYAMHVPTGQAHAILWTVVKPHAIPPAARSDR